MTRILHVADLHLQQKWFDWVASHCSEYDLLVVAGDLQNAFGNVSMHDQAREISKWLLSLRTPTVVCSGNHDFWCGDPRVSKDVYAEAGWLKMLRGRGNVIAADADTTEFHSIKIAVNGWLKVPDLRESVAIFVTHAPPVGCPCAGSHGQDFGDPALWDAVRYNPPRLILCGHVHEPRKLWCRWSPVDESTLVLVPGCDENADMPAHWMIDTDAGSATHSDGTNVALPMRSM